MNTSLHYYRAGMGLGQSGYHPTTGQIAGGVAAGVGTAVTQFIHGQYLGGAGTALMTAGLIPTPATPFLEIAGAAVELLGAIGIGQGCGQKCIVATQYADQAEALMQQNLATYMALPAPRDPSAQQAALNVFDQLWAGLTSVQACGNPNLGDPGKRCITDRQRGSCKWQTSPAPGCGSQNSCWTQDASGNCTFHTGGAAGSGNACWNWFIGYRDPIANDPCVSAGSSSVLPASIGGINSTWLMIGGGVMVLFFLIQGMGQ